ncbi:MAG TPA: preprotein translocase subunit SecG [Pyrinomonadaceae bacterium]|nr:preprotein translocase subunit SecG [Pyrinomonadaceae bacterium]
MVYFLYGLFFLSCFVLIAAVLLQPGKTDAGALFTSNVSSTAFSPRGTATVLSKITIAAAAVFMLSALFLAMPALTGNVSVLSSNPDAPVETPAEAPAATDSNTVVPNPATNTETDSNSALIETPATEAMQDKAANANTAQAPANTAPANVNQ